MDIITYALAKKVGKPSDSQVAEALDGYMTEHPEAALQDGAVTQEKLNNGVYATDAQISAMTQKIKGA
jgi:hypothetical protein